MLPLFMKFFTILSSSEWYVIMASLPPGGERGFQELLEGIHLAVDFYAEGLEYLCEFLLLLSGVDAPGHGLKQLSGGLQRAFLTG